MPLAYNDPQHWLDRASGARELADETTNREGQSRMMAIAEQYEQVAQRALVRLKAGTLAQVPNGGS